MFVGKERETWGGVECGPEGMCIAHRCVHTHPLSRSWEAQGKLAGVVLPPFTYTFFLYANFTLPDSLVNTILPPPCHPHPPYPTKSWPPSLSMFLPSICLSNFPLTYDMLILKMLAEFDETEIKPQQKKNQMLNKSSTLKKKKNQSFQCHSDFWKLLLVKLM